MRGTIAAVMFLAVLQASAQSREQELVQNALTVLRRALSSPTTAIPAAVVREARAIAVFPRSQRGAGFRFGYGVVGARAADQQRWLPPGLVSFRAVVRETERLRASDVLLVAVSRRGFDFLAQEPSVLPEGISIPPGPVGVNARPVPGADILGYARFGAVLAGATIDELAIFDDARGIERLYGRPWGVRDLLYGTVATGPPVAMVWRQTLEEYFREIR